MKNSGRFTQREIYSRLSILQQMRLQTDVMIGEGAEIYGEIHNSVIGPNVVIGKGSCDP